MVLNRLPTMQDPRLLPILTYISALAMLTNGDYIVFTELYELKKRLSVTEVRLQQHQVLLHFTLQKYTGTTLYKLHKDIQQQEEVLEVPVEVVGRVRMDEEDPCPPMGTMRYLPANIRVPWLPPELECISLGDENHSLAYQTYLGQCKDRNLAARSFHRFRKTMAQMMKAKGSKE